LQLSETQRQQRAVTAQQLLDNPVLQEAFQSLDTDLMNQLQHVKLDDKDGHTRLVMALQINNAVRRQLWQLIQDGAIATESLKLRGRRID
jgi:ABC-type thiamine transport system ATPase subunit